MSDSPLTILPDDFPLPGPNRNGSRPASTAFPWGLSLLLSILSVGVRAALRRLAALCMTLLLASGTAWWMYPSQVTSIMSFLRRFGTGWGWVE